MAAIRVMVLRTAGTNCDEETCQAFAQVGATAERVHVNRLIAEPGLLDGYQVLVIPGGFSYGDDIAAGKILANQLVHHFRDAVERFIAADKLVLGICNGFQVLVKAGILPGANIGAGGKEGADNNIDGGSVGAERIGAGQQRAPIKRATMATITYNDSGKFEDRWVYLQPGGDKCVFLEGHRRLYLPVAHGEGKVCFADQEVLEEVRAGGQVALRYVDETGQFGGYPVNPNGSTDHIAGLCDATGRVLGLMPHPERFVHVTHHPRWTREKIEQPDGLTLFERAVGYFS